VSDTDVVPDNKERIVWMPTTATDVARAQASLPQNAHPPATLPGRLKDKDEFMAIGGVYEVRYSTT